MLKKSPLAMRTEVSEEDLADLSQLQRLLFALNDPYAGGADLTDHVLKVPVLAARMVRTARYRFGQLDVREAATALQLVGNQVLEAELLRLLEDLTVAKSEGGTGTRKRENGPKAKVSGG